jgi:proliferating cell nuclear antigen
MAFHMTTSETELLKNSIPIIAEIVDEGVFNVDKTGITLLCPDRTMVAVVDFKLLSSAFEEYKVESNESLGVNMANFVSILKRVKGDEKLTFRSAAGKKLEIIVEGSSGKRKFEIPLIDVSMEKPPVEQLSFSSRIDINSSVLEDGIADADVVSDSVVFESKDSVFRMHAKGDISSAELELKKGDSGLIDMEAKGASRARYPLEYLKKMVKAAKFAGQASLESGTDYPMRLTFRIIDKLSLSFILAPRVED